MSSRHRATRLALLMAAGCTGAEPEPQPVACPQSEGSPRVVKLSAGSNVTAALMDDGTVFFWGKDEVGETAHPDNVGTTVLVPTRSPKLECIVGLDMGGAFGCAVDAAGTTVCWGAIPNENPPLNPGGGSPGPFPVEVPAFRDATSFALGGLLQGVTRKGQHQPSIYGSWASTDLTKTRIQAPAGWPFGAEPHIVKLPVAGGGQCGLDDGGTAYCFGPNDRGQIGDGTMDFADEPTPVVGLDSVAELAIRPFTRCALLTDGRVACWGDGPRGDGSKDYDFDYAPTPVFIEGINDAVGMTMESLGTTCVVREHGEVLCWAKGSPDGHVGPSGGNTLTPTPVFTDRTAVQVVAGTNHVCILTASNEVFCRGAGAHLGAGADQPAGQPVPQRVLLHDG